MSVSASPVATARIININGGKAQTSKGPTLMTLGGSKWLRQMLTAAEIPRL